MKKGQYYTRMENYILDTTYLNIPYKTFCWKETSISLQYATLTDFISFSCKSVVFLTQFPSNSIFFVYAYTNSFNLKNFKKISKEIGAKFAKLSQRQLLLCRTREKFCVPSVYFFLKRYMWEYSTKKKITQRRNYAGEIQTKCLRFGNSNID